MYLAQNIKYLRKARGWSQDDLAEMLGIARSSIASYEMRNVHPKIPVLNRMCKIFEITIDEMVNTSIYEVNGSKTSHPPISDHDLDKQLARLEARLLALEQAHLPFIENKPKVTSTESVVHLSRHDQHGKFVSWETLKIPNDHYIEVQPGVLDRLITSADDLQFKWESRFSKVLAEINFDKSLVLLNRSMRDSIFARHYHAEQETLYCVEGMMQEVISGQLTKSGQSIVFEPFEPHEIRFLADTYLVVVLER